MDQYRRDDLVFDVIDVGPADGTVIVLLHGFPERNTMWEGVIQRLTAQGYRCVAPNQRGYSPGARPTRRRDYRIDLLAEDVVALIDATGAQRVHVVGHDWGATVAWRVAQSFPDRLLTVSSLSVPHPGAFLKSLLNSRQLFASWYMYFFQLPKIPEWYLTSRRGTFTLAGMVQQRTGTARARAERETTAITEPGALTAALNWYRAIPLGDVRAASEKVSVPTLFVWSDGDVALLESGARATENYVTGDYRFEVLDGVSHWIVDERPAEVADVVLDWIHTHSD